MQYHFDSSSWELVLLSATTTLTVLMLLMCTCFKRKNRNNTSFVSKNGHVYGSTKKSNSSDTEVADEGLPGARATSHRRLPELPDPHMETDNKIVCLNSVRSSQDTSSELYAQVEIGTLSVSYPVTANLLENPDHLPNNTASFSSVVDPAEDSHPYDKVKSNHGYSKIKKAENPYAKVKRSDTMESEPAEPDENETDTDNYDVVYTLHTVDETKKSEAASSSLVAADPPIIPVPVRGSHSSLLVSSEPHYAPRPPPRGRRVQSAVLSLATSTEHLDRPHSDPDMMLAATSSDDEDANLPDELMNGGAAATAQIHFSGDSQTSQDSKGYSSISVREPIANLKAQQTSNRSDRTTANSVRIRVVPGQPHVDPHYATVSDAEDSDEMYAAIAEIPPLYDTGVAGAGATGSDTYAKINDRSSSASGGGAAGSTTAVQQPPTSPVLSVNTLSETERTTPSPSPVPPTPPSVVSLKQLSVGSSRLNTSTLSIASQTSVVGSPKPEKRQANSPLPPPPFADTMADGTGNRGSMNIEEMYAKVMKQKKGFTMPWQTASTTVSAAAADPLKSQLQHRGSVDLGFLTSRDDEAFMYNNDSSRRNSVDSTPHRTDFNNETVVVVEINAHEGAVSVVEEVEEEEEDFRYECLPSAVRNQDHGYEKIQLKSEDSFNDPRYERIHLKREVEIVEPNYEIVGYKCNEIVESDEPGYEEVELRRQAFSRGDPNYESLNYSVHSAKIENQKSSDPIDSVTELSNNNSCSSEAPVYAQVVKPKTLSPTNEEHNPNQQLTNNILLDQDLSVGSSRNTTIVRITNDNHSSAFNYFSDDEAFGTPEQV